MQPATGTSSLLDITTTSCHICCRCCCCCCCCCIEYYRYRQHSPLCYDSPIHHPCYPPPPPEPYCDHPPDQGQHPLEAGGHCSLCSGISEQHSVLSTDDTESLETAPKDKHRGAAAAAAAANNQDYQRKQLFKKQHAVDELLQTERDYVEDLSYLVEVYFETLSRQDWIFPEHKATIIRNAVDLLAFHRELWADLCVDNNSVDEYHIAKMFLKKGNGFMLYNGYCDDHSEAWRLCEEYRERPEWSTFLKECVLAASTPGSSTIASGMVMDSPLHVPATSRRLQFEDYLIKPVQRICRYPLLLKEIVRHTSPDTVSHDMLSEALGVMQDVVKEIDRRKNERELQDKTQRFLQRLDADWRWNKNQTEKILGQLLVGGALEVTYTAIGQSIGKPRYLGCFVFQHYIFLVRPKKVSVYEPKHWFPLRLAELEDIPDSGGEGQREMKFVIQCKKHAFAFSASCSQEKQVWIKAIRQAINNAKQLHTTQPAEIQQLEDLIGSSLPGLLQTNRQQNVRLSRSYTSIIDVRGSSDNYEDTTQKKATLRRSLSTSFQLEDHREANEENNSPAASPSPRSSPSNKKRYTLLECPSAHQTRKDAMKSRANSDSFIKTLKNEPDNAAALTRKRPGSLDLLTSTSTNVIGKMSFQLRNNHQNALRMAVDHKLHDVCTEDYLSAKAWYLREKEISSSASGIDLKKRKSAPFIRSSASSFSIISPRRVSNGSILSRQLPSPDMDMQSTTSSAASSIDVDTSVMRPAGRRLSSPWRSAHQSRQCNAKQHHQQQQVVSETTNTATLSHKTTDDDLEYMDIPSTAFTHSKASDYDENGRSVPFSVFSGLDRSFSTYSMQPLRHGVKSMIVGKMLKLSHFNKRSERRGRTTPAFDASSRCTSTPEDLYDESDANSFNACSEVECSRQGTLSDPSLQLRDMQDDDERKKKPVFRWVRSDSGVISQTTTTPTMEQHRYRRGNSQRSPLAFAYASTPAATAGESQKPRWKWRFTQKPQVRPP